MPFSTSFTEDSTFLPFSIQLHKHFLSPFHIHLVFKWRVIFVATSKNALFFKFMYSCKFLVPFSNNNRFLIGHAILQIAHFVWLTAQLRYVRIIFHDWVIFWGAESDAVGHLCKILTIALRLIPVRRGTSYPEFPQCPYRRYSWEIEKYLGDWCLLDRRQSASCIRSW